MAENRDIQDEALEDAVVPKKGPEAREVFAPVLLPADFLRHLLGGQTKARDPLATPDIQMTPMGPSTKTRDALQSEKGKKPIVDAAEAGKLPISDILSGLVTSEDKPIAPKTTEDKLAFAASGADPDPETTVGSITARDLMKVAETQLKMIEGDRLKVRDKDQEAADAAKDTYDAWNEDFLGDNWEALGGLALGTLIQMVSLHNDYVPGMLLGGTLSNFSQGRLGAWEASRQKALQLAIEGVKPGNVARQKLQYDQLRELRDFYLDQARKKAQGKSGKERADIFAGEAENYKLEAGGVAPDDMTIIDRHANQIATDAPGLEDKMLPSQMQESYTEAVEKLSKDFFQPMKRDFFEDMQRDPEGTIPKIITGMRNYVSERKSDFQALRFDAPFEPFRDAIANYFGDRERNIPASPVFSDRLGPVMQSYVYTKAKKDLYEKLGWEGIDWEDAYAGINRIRKHTTLLDDVPNEFVTEGNVASKEDIVNSALGVLENRAEWVEDQEGGWYLQTYIKRKKKEKEVDRFATIRTYPKITSERLQYEDVEPVRLFKFESVAEPTEAQKEAWFDVLRSDGLDVLHQDALGQIDDILFSELFRKQD
jgi:hypothetical protein